VEISIAACPFWVRTICTNFRAEFALRQVLISRWEWVPALGEG
jgi:hypothetical protein